MSHLPDSGGPRMVYPRPVYPSFGSQMLRDDSGSSEPFCGPCTGKEVPGAVPAPQGQLQGPEKCNLKFIT